MPGGFALSRVAVAGGSDGDAEPQPSPTTAKKRTDPE